MPEIPLYIGGTALPLLILLVASAAFAALSVSVYFSALRPRKGTIEWIARIDKPHFSTPRISRLQRADAVSAPIAVLCAVGLALADALLRLPALTWRDILQTVIPVSVFALGVYFLLRCLFGKSLPAFCGAVSAALLQGAAPSDAAVCAALALLYCWMCAPADRPTLPRGLWLIGSVLFLTCAQLLRPQTAWLLPAWLGAYVFAQIVRWRNGDPDRRGGRLMLSVFLTMLLCALMTVALMAADANLSGRMTGGFNVLRSLRFYRTLFPALAERFAQLLVLPTAALWTELPLSDVFLLLCGAAATVCAIHGAVRQRECRCILLTALLLVFAVLWVLGGTYLMTLPCILLLGWMWKICAERGHTYFVILFPAAVISLYGAIIFIG